MEGAGFRRGFVVDSDLFAAASRYGCKGVKGSNLAPFRQKGRPRRSAWSWIGNVHGCSTTSTWRQRPCWSGWHRCLDLGSEIPGHFRLEEESLFPLLVDAGEATIVELLNQEHEVIEPLMGRIAVLAREVRAQEFTAESWSEFFRLGGELVERLLIHIEKEEVGLLPLLEDVLDADADADVAGDYVMNQR
jgi:hypothetical protein